MPSSPSARSGLRSLGYDGQNRVKTMTTSDALVTNYTYYPDDLLKDTTNPSGVKASRTYDKADRLLTLENATTARTVSRYVYTYDPDGNRSSGRIVSRDDRGVQGLARSDCGTSSFRSHWSR